MNSGQSICRKEGKNKADVCGVHAAERGREDM